MSSFNGTPFQDISNMQNQDPRELKRERNREYYAKNKDEIAKRRRQARELIKQSTTPVNDENMVCDTLAIGQSGVTQLYTTPASGVASVVQKKHGDQENPGRMRPDLIAQTDFHAADVEPIVGCNNVALGQLGASSSRSHHQIRRCQQQQSGQSWYARLTDERKSDYIQRQRLARQKKKAASESDVNCVEVSQTPSASLRISQRTPLSNITNTHANEVCADASPYARLPDQKKSDHLMKLRVSWQQNKATDLRVCGMVPQTYTSHDTHDIGEVASAYSGMTKDLQMPCSESAMLDNDDSDWLHRNGTYMRDTRSLEELQNVSTSSGLHEQDNFLAKSAYAEKKRQHDSSEETWQHHRERYSLMTDAQRDSRLHKNREYKKCIRGNMTISDHDDIVSATTGSAINSCCTPIIQAQQSNNQRTGFVHLPGDTNDDEDFDAIGIFEPIEQDNVDTVQEEQTMHDDDEECRIFSGQDDVFDSWRVTSGVAPSNQNDDPYDYVYHNLPTKHHVLKPVKDCDHCGAMRLQYEGPAFCCRKGKVIPIAIDWKLRFSFMAVETPFI